MSPSIRIPDGFVFVARKPGIAADLLAAADSAGVDRHMSVRTVTGGYHVTEAVAEKYQEGFEAVTEDEEAVGSETDEQAIRDAEESTEGAEESEDTEESQGEPARPDESWTVAEIEDWASKQEPPIEFPADATKKADKLAFIHTPAE